MHILIIKALDLSAILHIFPYSVYFLIKAPFSGVLCLNVLKAESCNIIHYFVRL